MTARQVVPDVDSARDDAPGPVQLTQRRRERVPSFVWLFLAGLVANMFAGNWGYLGLPIGVDRALLLLGVVLLLLDPATRLPRFGLTHAVMAACVAWDAVSWISTGSLRDSLKLFALSDRVVVPLVMFVLGSLVFSTEWRRVLLLRTLALMSIYLGVTAIGEMAHLDALVWPRFILNPEFGIHYGRARGPFLESEAMGMTCALTYFASGFLAMRSKGPWRWIAGAGVLFGLTGVVLCLTRTAWISTVVGSVLIAALVPAFRRWAPLVFGGVVAVTVLVLSSFPAIATTLSDRLTTTRSVYDRITTNDAALRIVDAHPLTGVGWGRFLEVSPIWIHQGDTIPLTNVAIEVHNVFLSRAAETGLIGAGLWIACMLVGPVRVLIHRAGDVELQGWRVLTLAAIVVWLLPSVASPNNYPLPNNLIWLIGGIAAQGLLPLRGASRAGTSAVTVDTVA